ncbi:MAG: PorP/SprF family type IX secretion system membrane protein [Cryomorphaceae bacterium]|nr:PorP/SprF family type IX secretion system membrane protein [Cryomorphaceae bacterium]
MEQYISFVRRLAFIILLGWPLLSSGQDPIFSQFFLNRLYLNPSYAGIGRDLTVSAVSRQQWTSLPGRFRTNLVTADVACPSSGIGFGLRVIDHYSGEAGYGKFDFAPIVSVNIPARFGRKFPIKSMRQAKYIFGIGLQYGLGQTRIDWNRLVFTDQINAYHGLVAPQSNANIGNDVSNLTHDLSAGMLFRGELNKHGSFFSLGASTFHINQPRETMIGIDRKLERRYTFHGFTHFKISPPYRNQKDVFLSVGYIFNTQSNLYSNTLHTSRNFGDNFLIGLSFRSEQYVFADRRMESFIFNMSYEWKGLTIAYSYDIVVSQLGAQSTGGSHEIGLIFRFENLYLCKDLSQRKKAEDKCFLVEKRNRSGAYDMVNY